MTLTSGAALEPQPGAGEAQGRGTRGLDPVSGRTPGDLIVFLDCPRSHQPERLIGTIQKVTSRIPALSLSGTLI